MSQLFIQITTMGLAAAASAEVSAAGAPKDTSAAVRAGVWFQAVTACPAPRKARANALPMAPRPIMVTSFIACSSPSFSTKA